MGARLINARAVTPSIPPTIVTTVASSTLADIHHRQPSIIDPNRLDDCLHPMLPVPRLPDLVREPSAGPYERRTVSRRVTNVRNDDLGILATRSDVLLTTQWESNPRPKVFSGNLDKKTSAREI